MKRIAYFLLIAVVLVGCKSSKRLTATKVPEVTASEAAIPSFDQISGFQTSSYDAG